jgi:hypothetical protein
MTYYSQIRSGLKVTMRCHNTSNVVSDQGKTCKDWMEPYDVYNNNLNYKLFGRVHPIIAKPHGRISNEDHSDPLVQFAHHYFDFLNELRSPTARSGPESRN